MPITTITTMVLRLHYRATMVAYYNEYSTILLIEKNQVSYQSWGTRGAPFWQRFWPVGY
jgi:hypothetical protein